MNCPTCGYKMVRIMCGTDFICQNDNCGDDVEWCNKCDKPETDCFCCFYDDEEDEQ